MFRRNVQEDDDMKRFSKVVSLFLAAAVLLLGASPALAAPALQTLPACTADPITGKVAGTIVAVDQTTGVVTVLQASGSRCTVDINVDETHPIALLLGRYFGDIQPESLVGAIEDATGCLDQTTGAWVPQDQCAPGEQPVQVIRQNPDGTFTFELPDTSLITVTVVNTATVSILTSALFALDAQWELEADGSLKQVSDEIAAYHDSGMGFGVLVKLYAIAQASCVADPAGQAVCGVSVEELVARVTAGEGIGQLFKEYGKPDKLGVGHVRQDLDGKDKDKDKDKNKEKGPGSDFIPPGQEKKADKPAKGNQLKDMCKSVTKSGKPKGNAPVTCP
jgi:hypothetical protein